MFHGWENFFFMVGSAAAGLIGLLFVIVTLTAGFDRDQALRGQALYMTPTIFSFGLVLATSAVAVAPGIDGLPMGIIIGAGAVGVFAASIRGTVGILRPRPGAPRPHWSDAWMYGLTPAVLCLFLLAAAAGLAVRAVWSPYATAASQLVMLLVAIRNAWDLVTALAPARRNGGPGVG